MDARDGATSSQRVLPAPPVFSPEKCFTLLPATGGICEILPKTRMLRWCGMQLVVVLYVVCGGPSGYPTTDEARSKGESGQEKGRARQGGGRHFEESEFRFS